MDRDYKIEHTEKHRAKFRGDRPTELGDYAAKTKETIVFGRTKNGTTFSLAKKKPAHGFGALLTCICAVGRYKLNLPVVPVNRFPIPRFTFNPLSKLNRECLPTKHTNVRFPRLGFKNVIQI